MAKAKRYFYLVDNLDATKADVISRGLKALTTVTGVSVNLGQGIVEVVATVNPDEHVKMACDVAGTVMRTKLKKRQMR